jgi:hypothetical protein
MDRAASDGQAAAGGRVPADLPPLESIAVCRSGGGIRSAAFHLRALRILVSWWAHLRDRVPAGGIPGYGRGDRSGPAHGGRLKGVAPHRLRVAQFLM